MIGKPAQQLRRGWTTGACAAGAVKAALAAFWGGRAPAEIGITLPRGETPLFPIAHRAQGDGWAEAGVTKDAGDDPDVTHGALIVARVAPSAGGVTFHAGEGVGTVTLPGLPVPVGQPAINPVPRRMIREVVEEQAATYGKKPDISVTISIPGGRELAAKTWNPRLGVKGGLSVLGTTGVVRPFSCSAWIASIHRGVDVAIAAGLGHVAGATGATSERVLQELYHLPDHAMLDMGDFAGGLLKYLKKHPVPRLTIGGGIGKITKLAQGAMDLHSARSQVDFARLGEWSRRLGLGDAGAANTALEAVAIAGPGLAEHVAAEAKRRVVDFLGPGVAVDIVVIDREGGVLARTDPQ